MGAKGSIEVFDLVTRAELPCPVYGVEEVQPFHMIIQASTGGGWGNPQERDPLAVLRDVRDGVVSRRSALDIYGVEISEDGKSVVSIDARKAA